MIRYYTANRDELIYKELRRGKEPKEIKMRLGLTTIDVVYKAMGRLRRSMPRVNGVERRVRHLKLPKIADKSTRPKRGPAGTL